MHMGMRYRIRLIDTGTSMKRPHVSAVFSLLSTHFNLDTILVHYLPCDNILGVI